MYSSLCISIRRETVRAPELEGAVADSLNFFRRQIGRGDQQRARLIERVDQDVEAPSLVALLREKAWDAFDDDRGEAPGDRKVTGGGERVGA